MSDFLQQMCALSRRRYLDARQNVPLDEVVARARLMPAPPPLQLDEAGFDLIAEVKKSSPALGDLSDESDTDLIERAVDYAKAGAAAVSVLTEPSRFNGEMAHLETIAAALRPHNVPAMRKDFLVDVYQVWEAAAAGAGGVLAILRVLDDAAIMEMLEAAAQTRMFVLLEAFDDADLKRAQPFVNTYTHVLVGLNSRDLSTLEVDNDRLHRLADRFPGDCYRVAESGIGSPEDAAMMRRAGYHYALVGTALMRAANPRDVITRMLHAART